MRVGGKRKKGDDGNKVGQERWLLTYADMITLLLALFIVMYSMSKIDSEKFHNVTEALSEQLHKGRSIFEKSLRSDVIGDNTLDYGRLRLIQQRIKDRIRLESMRRETPVGISTTVDQRGLVIHIKESALFDPGSHILKDDAYEPLDIVSTQLKNINNPIRIEGHTDNTPINTPRFPSNWELSAARAISVIKYFIEKHEISPDQLSALGFGEFKPIADNATPEGRAQNRRVDIVVLAQSEIKNEPPSQPEKMADFEE
ncbi:MAG: OmpA family protein [candidate division Zixibacteria bacterium]|nr:OmpA family protein [candidate division Zixibacteria bacterium]